MSVATLVVQIRCCGGRPRRGNARTSTEQHGAAPHTKYTHTHDYRNCLRATRDRRPGGEGADATRPLIGRPRPSARQCAAARGEKSAGETSRAASRPPVHDVRWRRGRRVAGAPPPVRLLPRSISHTRTQNGDEGSAPRPIRCVPVFFQVVLRFSIFRRQQIELQWRLTSFSCLNTVYFEPFSELSSRHYLFIY